MSLHLFVEKNMGHGFRPIVSKIRCENPNKSGTRKKNYNMLRYIATREGVDLSHIDTIEDCVNLNVDLNEAGEEKLFSQADSEYYLKYIAHRPRSHGLFGNIDTEKFEDVSRVFNKASDEKKIIYKGIISLSELDAQALGYNTASKWNSYLNSIMPDIAKELGLSPNNITWVAAFHAEQNHPHVHYMLWDNRDIIKEPFIKVSQQNACREICQNAMFTDANEAIIREITEKERKEYYTIQNDSRDNITSYVRDFFSKSDYIPGIDTEKLPGRMKEETHRELNELYKKVLATMPGRGRIAYKYMPMECKAYIDRITDIFLKEADIKEEYHKYVNSIHDIHKILGKTKMEIAKAQNDGIKELQARTGNIILKGICGIKKDILGEDIGTWTNTNHEVTESDSNEVHNLLMDSATEHPVEESEKMDSNVVVFPRQEQELEAADITGSELLQKKDFIGTIRHLLKKDGEEYNPIEAEKLLLEKLKDASPKQQNYICKKLGELYADNYSVLHNYEEALYYLEDCVDPGAQDSNVHALLGKIYADKSYSGNDCKRAEYHFQQAIKDPKKNYLKLRLSRMYADASSELCDYNKALGILMDYEDNKGSVTLQQGNIFSDERCPFYSMEEAVNCYQQSVEKGNEYAAYQLGLIKVDEESKYFDIMEGADLLAKAAEADVLPAKVKLGKVFMDKENAGLFKNNFSKAHQQFSSALEQIKKEEEQPYSKLPGSDIQTKAQLYYNFGKLCAAEEEENLNYNAVLAMQYFKMAIDTYEKSGDTNNIIINSTYLKMAKLCMNSEEITYGPKYAEEYLMTAYRNTLELENVQESKGTDDINKGLRQSIQLKLSSLYMDENTYFWNLDKAMNMVKYENDGKGFFALRRGNIYANEKYSGYDMKKAVESYLESAAADNTTAMVKLSKCYLYGMGVDRDKDKAMEWLNKAVEMEDEYAIEFKKKMDSMKFNGYTYSFLRQIFSSMSQANHKNQQRLREAEFKTVSKQVKKEEYLHHN